MSDQKFPVKNLYMEMEGIMCDTNDTTVNIHMINNRGFIWNTDGKNVK